MSVLRVILGVQEVSARCAYEYIYIYIYTHTYIYIYIYILRWYKSSLKYSRRVPCLVLQRLLGSVQAECLYIQLPGRNG